MQDFDSRNKRNRVVPYNLEKPISMSGIFSNPVTNIDATIIAQVPRLAPHQQKMRANVAALLGPPEERVNIKVTSTDRLGAIGREEGIAAMAAVLLEPLAE